MHKYPDFLREISNTNSHRRYQRLNIVTVPVGFKILICTNIQIFQEKFQIQTHIADIEVQITTKQPNFI